MDGNKAIGKISLDNPSVKKGKNFLLSIGINHYKDKDIPTLSNAVRDIEHLETVLTQQYDFHLQLKLTNELAHRTAILDALEEMESLSEHDNLIVFFSGHGYKKSKNGFIVPFDGKNNKTSDYISYADLKVKIEELKVRHFLLILDCCYAGSVLKKMEGKTALNKPSRRILAASSPDETAEDGFIGRNSPFTASLVKVLQENIRTELPVKTLFSDLRNLMDAKGVRQVPIEGIWQMEGNEGGEFIFMPVTRENPEDALWQQVVAQNTVEGYSKYLRQYRNGKYAEQAEQALEDLENKKAIAEEDAAWKEATDKHTLLAYHRYLRKYPKGRYATEADKQLDLLENVATADKPIVKTETPSERVNVYLDKAGEYKINVIKVLKDNLGLSLADAKDLIDYVPSLIAENVERQSVIKLLKELKELGAEYRVEKYNPSKPIIEVPKPNIIFPKKFDFEPEMVFVKGGTFIMGSEEGNEDEKPVHKVTVDDFYMGKFPITQKEWKALMGNNPSNFIGDNLPVETVTWDDCQAFIKKLNDKTNKAYRLPTEAEWEYAAREGGKNVRFGNGKDIADPVEMNFYADEFLKRDYSIVGIYRGKTTPVDSFKPNSLGLYDMSGNVWEWCNDWYDADYYKNSLAKNPKGSEKGNFRVLRGGGWDGPNLCRSAVRYCDVPNFRNDLIGFRVVVGY